MNGFSPSPRAAAAVALISVSALLLPPWVPVLALLALVATVVVDGRSVRTAPEVDRRVPQILSRGIASRFEVVADAPDGRTIAVDQSAPIDVEVDPRTGTGHLEGTITARRRGRHLLPAVGTRSEGPLRLGRWHHHGAEQELLVYPDLPEARRIATAVRQGRFRESGRLMRGPLGLGTDFESIRDYLPDDDIRQVNWTATARTGRPMSNQYRVEQDRDLICVVDSGRLMSAPIGDRTRIDAALDAVTAVAAVANVVGDRCGALAFDNKIIHHVEPRRAGGDEVVRALFDLEASGIDSDYELAFRAISGGKRSLIIVFTDIVEETAARSLLDAVPVLARRHAVIIASAADPAIHARVASTPESVRDVYAMSVALDVLDARSRVTARLTRSGATTIEAPPERLPSACVVAYLRAKARARM